MVDCTGKYAVYFTGRSLETGVDESRVRLYQKPITKTEDIYEDVHYYNDHNARHEEKGRNVSNGTRMAGDCHDGSSPPVHRQRSEDVIQSGARTTSSPGLLGAAAQQVLYLSNPDNCTSTAQICQQRGIVNDAAS